MNEEYSIHWLNDTIKSILERNLKKIILSTGKTPSGHIHIGIMREILICDALRRVLESQGKKVDFYLFLDDFDAAKRFPEYIDKDFQKIHIGKPFSLIPCPYSECQCESYAMHFGNELISTFEEFGIKNEIIWTYNLYQRKEMQNMIKIALENNETIKIILRSHILPTLDEEKRIKFLKMQEAWLPVMVLCENCNKLQSKAKDGSINPNRAQFYDEIKEQVYYKCNACKYEGFISIFSGRLKLNWRVDWPAKWALFETTCEPAGKDHSVKGGAYDTGLEICQKVYKYIGPIKLPYEWLRLGEYDMKTSKGIVFTPKKYLEMAEPEIYRMLILRTNPMKHISLRIEELPQYYDQYEHMENIYFNLESAGDQKEDELYKYIYPLTIIKKVPENKPIKIPFKLLTFLAQMQNILTLENLYEKAIENIQKIDKPLEFLEFRKLLKRTQNWLNEVNLIVNSVDDNKKKNEILNKVSLFTIPEEVDKTIINSLTDDQIKGLAIVKEYLTNIDKMDPDEIQNKMFKIAKEQLHIAPKRLFEAMYLILLGKRLGPRLGPFLSMLDKDWIMKRLAKF